MDDRHRIAGLIAQRIDEGMLDEGGGLERIAKQFGWSSRQIRRMVQKELGVSPIELVMTRRLLLAKQLLTETTLPMTRVAFASGFASLRRFNDAFGTRYGMPPSRFRKAVTNKTEEAVETTSFTLQLGYRAPFDWQGLLDFLAARTLKGVELVDGGHYVRSAHIGAHSGWVRMGDNPSRRTLNVELSHSLTPVLPALLGRLRNLFDLTARPDVIARHLEKFPELAASVQKRPGLRVPGAFDGFELAVRAILGQQVSVKAATTIAARFSERFGDPVVTPYKDVLRLSPTPQRVAGASVDSVASLGIVTSRARSIVAVAIEVASGRLQLEAGGDPLETMERLVAIPGIGAWTAHYIAMRALRWPDAFPKEDLVIRKRLGGATAAQAEKLSRVWRPWRSYATLHLWRGEPIG